MTFRRLFLVGFEISVVDIVFYRNRSGLTFRPIKTQVIAV